MHMSSAVGGGCRQQSAENYSPRRFRLGLVWMEGEIIQVAGHLRVMERDMYRS